MVPLRAYQCHPSYFCLPRPREWLADFGSSREEDERGGVDEGCGGGSMEEFEGAVGEVEEGTFHS